MVDEAIQRSEDSGVVFLDEIDKMGMDNMGDPAAALLEVLDPAQNGTFQDHYIDTPFDLSQVTFIATANNPDTIPGPLWDRLEVIQVPGYTRMEKKQIALTHICPKQLSSHGLTPEQLEFKDEGVEALIESYTREAGVRNLEREIMTLARKATKEIILRKLTKVAVTRKNLKKFAGVPKYRFGEAEREDLVGVTTGLAWTEVGGELLTVEAVALPGKGKIMTTGKLGEVMQESIQAALSVVRRRSKSLGIQEDFYQKSDIHIHLPEGAIPKDGPSAGIAICTGLVSVLTGIPVRCDVAMTGEITLRGEVLPIGGLKEKLLAAVRGGITRALIPQENVKDLTEIPDNVKNALEIIPVKWIDQVLEHALERVPEALPDTPTSDVAVAKPAEPTENGEVVKH